MQLQQVWTDPPARRQGFAGRALRDLIRLLLDGTPTVCLFVRAENAACDPALRVGRDAPRARLPLRAPVKHALILARHAHAASNVGDIVNAVPPGGGLSATGIEEARALGRLLAAEPIDLGVSSRLQRAQETLALALAGRTIPARDRTAPRRDRVRLLRGRPAARVPQLGLGARRPTPPARAGARPGRAPRPVRGRPRARCSRGPKQTRPRGQPRPPRPLRPRRRRRRVSRRDASSTSPHATPHRLERATRRAGGADAARLGRERRASPIPRLVDDARPRSPSMHTSA